MPQCFLRACFLRAGITTQLTCDTGRAWGLSCGRPPIISMFTAPAYEQTMVYVWMDGPAAVAEEWSKKALEKRQPFVAGAQLEAHLSSSASKSEIVLQWLARIEPALRVGPLSLSVRASTWPRKGSEGATYQVAELGRLHQ